MTLLTFLSQGLWEPCDTQPPCAQQEAKFLQLDISSPQRVPEQGAQCSCTPDSNFPFVSDSAWALGSTR